jgi:SAM-dependent methyltransferase
MRLKEKLLLSLSRKPGENDYSTFKEECKSNNALSILFDVFPNFIESIKNKEILDFGCGLGKQTIALAENGAKFVLGIDINEKFLREARNSAEKLILDGKVRFTDSWEKSFAEKFDMVISQNSMEHFDNPINIFNRMKSALKPHGVMLITFGPPWFAPYGSHTQFFTKLPWVNLFFDEKTIIKVRSNFRNDGAKSFKEVEGGLNKLTVAGFEKIIAESGIQIIYRKYDCVKGLDALGKIPLIRELFINRISCIIQRFGGEISDIIGGLSEVSPLQDNYV